VLEPTRGNLLLESPDTFARNGLPDSTLVLSSDTIEAIYIINLRLSEDRTNKG